MTAIRLPRTVLLLALLGILGACGNDSEPSTTGFSAEELAARGEEAFFDTLGGVAERTAEAISDLSAAVAKNPSDGHSQFHLGMIHLFRFAQSVSDYQSASTIEKDDVSLAQKALEAAVPLLPDDRRVPGFRAAATYMLGVVTHDQAGIDQGLQQLRDAYALFPEFNSFDFIATVGAVVSAKDPLYQEVLQILGDPLMASCTPFNEPKLCGNFGKAPHNVEGALILFGDLFAKGGNLVKAKGYYNLAKTPFASAGGPWRFQSLVQQRLDTVKQRIALYQDDDPSNDPPLVGYHEEACAVCHDR
ncbi:MAG: hypothetical protein HY270_13745 [Deltaproteobacteria bacterium]|nr:hypothetical protein [Deltaproteobacteria bacterium]